MELLKNTVIMMTQITAILTAVYINGMKRCNTARQITRAFAQLDGIIPTLVELQALASRVENDGNALKAISQRWDKHK